GSSAPGSDPTAAEALFSVYSCDASLSCLTKVYDFPVGWTLDDARMLPSGLPYFVMSDQSNPKVLKVWRMDTGGGVHEWSSLNDRLPDIGDVPGLFPRISVTEAGPASRWSYARFSYVPSSSKHGPPTDQVFASADDGTTWRRMSYGRHVSQRGRPKGIPWQLRTGPPHAEGDIHAPSDDTLMIVARLLRGDGSSYDGVFCSFDRGRKWYEGCRRP
ncbi:MAG TPA: hypothetical protein VHJ76_00730, partial [Actinomycetota bacterium]|nr:hypothetical protein [Actinomycetota bacterium]